ncbi:MAG: T9SS type A sorting domain-containing protein [Hymenobacter sp.]|nr:MAG: T9SS type A sorting domain-containing protein [Hymenobacter sp.]
MHTPTFSRKTSLSKFSWRNFLPLIAFILALGSSRSASAQAGSINDDIIALTLQPSGQAAQPTQNYAGSDNTGAYTYKTTLGLSDDNTVAVPQLGTYDLNGSGSSALTISGASLSGIRTSNNTTVTATRLQYRVYLAGTAEALKPNYTVVSLATTQAAGTGVNLNFSGTGTANANILTGLTSGGTYVLDVNFQADLMRNTSSRTVGDPSTSYFYANFYITPPTTTPPGGTTTWQSTTASGGSTNWNNAANWTNGVPTRLSNAVIPQKSTSSTIIYPILNNPAPTTPYEVNNLSLEGAQNSSAAQLIINTATLYVYGNINQESDGILGNTTNTAGVTDPLNNATIVFAGADQVIIGNVVVSDIIIAGTGTKSVINQLTPTNILAFQPSSVTDGVIVQSALQRSANGPVETVFSTNGRAYIQLLSTSTISTVPGQAETNVSYIKGVTRADRGLSTGIKNTFGNIGIDITANHPVSNLVVYRIVGDALTGPLSSTAVPIKRQYQLTGDDNSNNAAFANSTIDVVFHYLDSNATTSANELNGIDESNLTMFRTVTNGTPYEPLFGTLDAVNNIVTRTNLNSLTDLKLTLGDKTNPLPVSLTAFTAVRNGGNSLLSWTTASEQNNTGFEVQVSTDGATFRKLAFVATQNANSTQKLVYTYTDTETGKTGVRYYRLRQIDTDETESFSPIRTVSFSGATTGATALTGYPNPFTNKLDFNLDATAVGNGAAHIQLVDMTGRIVLEKDVKVANASLTLTDLDGLRSGLYLAKVTLPDGTTQKVRVQKQ